MSRRRRRRWPLRFAVPALLLLLLVLAAGAAVRSLFTPFQGFSGEAFVEIAKGISVRAIADELVQNGAARSRWQFLAVRLLRPSARLQAGEYRFAHPDSAWNIFDRIVRGDVFYYELTVPEGSNMFDIAAVVDRLGFLNSEDFLRAARAPALVRDIAPAAPTLEGYLFPSTYRVTRSATVRQLCRMMTEEFRRQWHALDPPAEIDVHRAVTMASMVEKETAVEAERPAVASVYYNRLDRGMALDCDPTTHMYTRACRRGRLRIRAQPRFAPRCIRPPRTTCISSRGRTARDCISSRRIWRRTTGLSSSTARANATGAESLPKSDTGWRNRTYQDAAVSR